MANNYNKRINPNRIIKQKYGSRKGMIYNCLYKILYHFGYYKRFETVDWQSVKRLVFVCKGNVCRSAYANILAQSQNIESISCGLDAIDDAYANDMAINVSRKHGYDLSVHRSRALTSIDIRKTDLLVAMEPWQTNKLISSTKNKYQYTLLGLWGNTKTPYIHDPYSLSEEYFDNCFKSIEESVNAIIKKVS